MGFFTAIAAGFNFLKPALKAVGGIVCQAGSTILDSVGRSLSGNGPTRRILENADGIGGDLSTISDVENAKDLERLANIQKMMELGIPEDTASVMVDKIGKAVQDEQTVTTTGNIQMEVLTYGDDFKIDRDVASYLPITAYSFKNDILQKMDKYNYLLPLLIYTEIKNTSADSGVRLDGAVTTAYDNSWLKADSASIMSNLQPLSIDNKNTIVDLQAVSQEVFATYTVKELQDKYIWLQNPRNLDMMYKNRFPDKDIGKDDTTRDPENGIMFKETKREEPQWIPYSVFTTMLNGIQNRNPFSKKTILFTGYAIKPRDEMRSTPEDSNNEANSGLGTCSVSVRSYLICLGIQNEQDSNKKMITNPRGIEITIPSTNGGSEVELLTPEQVQNYAAKRFLTISQAKTKPSLLIEQDNATVFDIWARDAAKEKNQTKKEDLLKLIQHGVAIMSPMENDPGFTIRE